MNEATRERLFGWRHAFDHPATVWLVGAVLAVLLLSVVLVFVLDRCGKLTPTLRRELWLRLLSWGVLLPALVLPILLGAFWAMLGTTVLGLLCFREFARATGLFRERFVSVLVVIGMLALGFATVDHWYDFFMALVPLGVVLIAGFAVVTDQPQGYIQRAALGVFAFLLFGVCLGHFGYMANDVDYRPVMLFVLTAVELNDVFAYCSGRLFGRRRLAPHTSPNKTWGGAIGAVVLNCTLVLLLGKLVFDGRTMAGTGHLLGLGVLISVGGQLGDLMLSAIKRDLGIKDFANTLPGHGGLLDRFDSLLFVAPAVFHYVGYLQGFGLDGARRVLTGS